MKKKHSKKMYWVGSILVAAAAAYIIPKLQKKLENKIYQMKR